MFYGVLRDGASSSVPKRHTKTHVRTHKRIFHNQRGKFCRSKYKNSLIFLLRPQRGKQTAQYFPLKHSIKTRFHFHISTHSKLNSIKYKRKHHLSFFSPLKLNLRKKTAFTSPCRTNWLDVKRIVSYRIRAMTGFSDQATFSDTSTV